jgi:hypothetical protein
MSHAATMVSNDGHWRLRARVEYTEHALRRTPAA